jgi:hypothetical protein
MALVAGLRPHVAEGIQDTEKKLTQVLVIMFVPRAWGL